MAVRTVFPRHSISRGSPTLTESNRTKSVSPVFRRAHEKALHSALVNFPVCFGASSDIPAWTSHDVVDWHASEKSDVPLVDSVRTASGCN